MTNPVTNEHRNEHRIVFTPSGLRGTVPDGTTVLDAAVRLGADLDTVCGGRGICGRCQIELGSIKGVDSDPARISPPAESETAYRGRKPLLQVDRLFTGQAVH